MNTRNLFFSALLIAALALGAGLILAQDEGGNGDVDSSAKQHDDNGRRGGFHFGRGFPGCGGRGMVKPGGFGMPGGAALTDLVTTATGLETDALYEALRGGDTLASLIEANGGDVEAFIAEATDLATENATARISERLEAMVRGEYGVGAPDADFVAGLQEAMNAWLEEAVAAGSISQERADAYRDAMSSRMEALESGEFPRGMRGRGRGGWRGWFHGEKDSGETMDDETTETDNG